MKTDLKRAAKLLLESDNIVILTHQNPDGDTLGSAFALYYTLTARGKKVRVENEKAIPKKYAFLHEGYRHIDFEPECIVAVDIASTSLLGKGMERYSDKIDLCIDHHKSNADYAKQTLLSCSVAAACEIVYDVIIEMDNAISDEALLCIYTGISTDCGCFKYSNTTAKAHDIAALAIERHIDIYKVNQAMFECKSRAQLAIEKTALQNLEFYHGGKCAVIVITHELLEATGAEESDLDALPAMTRQIQGVEVGVVIKEREKGEFKVSMRTGKHPDASVICSQFGGGGHAGAAGCTLYGEVKEVEDKVIKTIGRYI